jgi:hypothetical protein
VALLRKGVAVLCAFDASSINQNLAVLDTLIGVENDYFSITKGMYLRETPLLNSGGPNGHASASSSFSTFKETNFQWKPLIENDPIEIYAKKIWNTVHAMKVQVKKYAAGKVGIEKLQHRNEASLKKINDFVQKVRILSANEFVPSNTVSDFRREGGTTQRARRLSVFTMREGFEEEFNSIKCSIYTFLLENHIFFYMPHRSSLQVYHLGTSIVDAPVLSLGAVPARGSGTVSFKLSVIKRNDYVTVTTKPHMSIAQLIFTICQVYN